MEKGIQAVVIADSLENKFEPLADLEVPQCLLPVANRELIDYSIKLLEQNEIKNICIATN